MQGNLKKETDTWTEKVIYILLFNCLYSYMTPAKSLAVSNTNQSLPRYILMHLNQHSSNFSHSRVSLDSSLQTLEYFSVAIVSLISRNHINRGYLGTLFKVLSSRFSHSRFSLDSSFQTLEYFSVAIVSLISCNHINKGYLGTLFKVLSSRFSHSRVSLDSNFQTLEYFSVAIVSLISRNHINR